VIEIKRKNAKDQQKDLISKENTHLERMIDSMMEFVIDLFYLGKKNIFIFLSSNAEYTRSTSKWIRNDERLKHKDNSSIILYM